MGDTENKIPLRSEVAVENTCSRLPDTRAD